MERIDHQRNEGRKLSRQRSRLQMHAPSSIQVAPAAASAAAVADWNVAIPLLSPIDIVSLPPHSDEAASRDARQPSDDEKQERAQKWAAWQHQAAPFYYEPVAGKGPAFLSPHRA